MLGDDDERAVRVARETLAMVEEFASIEIRAQALNVIGTSRVKLGEREGIADLERCIEITEPGSYERLRGFIDLGSSSVGSESSRAAPRCAQRAFAKRNGSAASARFAG